MNVSYLFQYNNETIDNLLTRWTATFADRFCWRCPMLTQYVNHTLFNAHIQKGTMIIILEDNVSPANVLHHFSIGLKRRLYSIPLKFAECSFHSSPVIVVCVRQIKCIYIYKIIVIIETHMHTCDRISSIAHAITSFKWKTSFIFTFSRQSRRVQWRKRRRRKTR